MSGKITLYFAYGSNLNIQRIRQRIGRTPNARRVELAGYQLLFNKRGSETQSFANITDEKNGRVLGVIYECSESELKDLDRHEGVAGQHYTRHLVWVTTESGERLQAVTYIAGENFICENLQPTDDYLQIIISGASHHGLPTQYIDEIKEIARRKR